MFMVKVLLCVALIVILEPEGSEAWRPFRLIRIVFKAIRRWVRRKREESVPVTPQFCTSIEKAMITRDQWKAVKARQEEGIESIPNKVVLHQTGANTCQVMGLSGVNCQRCLEDESCIKDLILALQNEALEKGKADIGYNFLIDQNGVIYEGRGWNLIGEHTPEHDKTSIGVAFIGDFSKSEPNLTQQIALKNLLLCGQMDNVLSQQANYVTEPSITGKAFDEMVRRCRGICVA